MHDRPAPVVISSEIVNRQDAPFGDAEPEHPAVADPRRGARLHGRVLEPVASDADGLRIGLGYRTASSRMTLGLAAELVVESAAPYETRCTAEADGGSVVAAVDAQPGVPITVTKLISEPSSAPRQDRNPVNFVPRLLPVRKQPRSDRIP